MPRLVEAGHSVRLSTQPTVLNDGRFSGLLFGRSLETFPNRSSNTQQTSAQQQHARRLRYRTTSYLSLDSGYSVVRSGWYEVQWIVGNRICNATNGHRRSGKVNYARTGIGGAKCS